MRPELIHDIDFAMYDLYGIKGAYSLIKQIIDEKEPKVGWVDNVIVQDMGHWSGHHPDHIKTPEHAEYYHEVGRKTTWA